MVPPDISQKTIQILIHLKHESELKKLSKFTLDFTEIFGGNFDKEKWRIKDSIFVDFKQEFYDEDIMQKVLEPDQNLLFDKNQKAYQVTHSKFTQNLDFMLNQ